jgi:hypothetical protein
VLIHIPFVPLYIHKFQLTLHIDKHYYKQLPQKEGHINRSKSHEEIIARRYVTYTCSPNGTVATGIKSSDTPFKIETDDDELSIFSFLDIAKSSTLEQLLVKLNFKY